MKPEDFAKSFEFLFDSLVSWAKCVRHPLLTCSAILAESKDETTAMKTAVKLWLTSYIVSMLLLGWVYKLHGIDITNFGFYLSSAFLVFASTVLYVLCLHIAFTVFKLSDSFPDTLVVATVMNSVFTPFLSILSAPSLMQTLDTLKVLKAKDLDLSDAVRAFFSMATAPTASTVSILNSIAVPFLSVAGFLILSATLNTLAARWHVDRVKAFSAGSFALAVVAPLPLTILAFINMMMIYSFL